ncbi:hypothetical protein LCGC14_2895370, partial [marine sediment metagenome]
MIETDFKDCLWEPIGGNKDNMRYIGNQKTNASGTLTELIINSIDSLLILGCIKSGKNPTELDAPKDMNDASELYYKIPNGDIYNCFPKEKTGLSGGWIRLSKNVKTQNNIPITKLAENINLIFLNSNHGKKRNTIIVYDKGTGQAPQDFKNTFLYHKTDNKLKIPFVQGKYGMGGTGVIPRCGLKKYVFILSCRHPDICKPSEKNKWGWTIIRKHEASKDEKMSYYEYLCTNTEDKEIFSFFSESIPNALSGNEYDYNKQTILTHEMRLGTY